jgi:hypothetical protein
MGRPQGRYERDGDEKNPIIAPVEMWTPVIQPVALSLYWQLIPILIIGIVKFHKEVTQHLEGRER